MRNRSPQLLHSCVHLYKHDQYPYCLTQQQQCHCSCHTPSEARYARILRTFDETQRVYKLRSLVMSSFGPTMEVNWKPESKITDNLVHQLTEESEKCA